jgi:glutathione peroxidase
MMIALAGIQECPAMPSTAHDFAFTSIGGGALPFHQFDGKAVLVVNTASACGLTPQYAGLKRMHDKYKARGLVVLGVPSNNFGAQEPGSSAEIQSFCATNYRVDFPLTEKVDVVGPQAHPFYRWAAGELGAESAPKWNFHKYLVGPDGRLAGFFASEVAPEAPEITRAVEALLPS